MFLLRLIDLVLKTVLLELVFPPLKGSLPLSMRQVANQPRCSSAMALLIIKDCALSAMLQDI